MIIYSVHTRKCLATDADIPTQRLLLLPAIMPPRFPRQLCCRVDAGLLMAG